MSSNFNPGNFALNDDMLNIIRTTIREQVPDAVYQQASQMNLMDLALNAVVQNAVNTYANQALSSNLGQSASPFLAHLPGLLGFAQQFGLDKMILNALENTNIDEELRDAIIEGFTRYMRDNAGQLAQLALQAIVQGIARSSR